MYIIQQSQFDSTILSKSKHKVIKDRLKKIWVKILSLIQEQEDFKTSNGLYSVAAIMDLSWNTLNKMLKTRIESLYTLCNIFGCEGEETRKLYEEIWRY